LRGSSFRYGLSVDAHARARRIAVRALDVGGAVLGQSATIEV